MQSFQLGKIHPTANVSSSAELGKNVTIGAYSLIHDNVHLGDNSVVGPYCILGEPLSGYYNNSSYVNPRLEIGANSVIRSGTVLYAGSSLGDRFECGHQAIIREKTKAGIRCRISTFAYLQGECEIGDYVTIYGHVRVATGTKLGNYVWVNAYTHFTNDRTPPSQDLVGVTVDDFAIIASRVTILPGVHIGKDAFIGSMSLVRFDVPDETFVAGVPAKERGKVQDIISKKTNKPAYPWRYYFDRGMPWEGMGYDNWAKQAGITE